MRNTLKQEVCYVIKMISCCYGVTLNLICVVYLVLTGLRKSQANRLMTLIVIRVVHLILMGESLR